MVNSNIFLITIMLLSMFFKTSFTQNDPAMIVVHPPNSVTAQESQSVQFTCVAYGNPLPMINWVGANEKLDRVTITNTNTTRNGTQFKISALTLCHLDTGDTKNYSCFTGNGNTSNTMASISLSVFSTESRTTSVIVAPSATTSMGTSVTEPTMTQSPNQDVTYPAVIGVQGFLMLLLAASLFIVSVTGGVCYHKKVNKIKEILASTQPILASTSKQIPLMSLSNTQDSEPKMQQCEAYGPLKIIAAQVTTENESPYEQL